MADVEVIKNITEYLKKMERIINTDAVFHFSDWQIVEKLKIDDLMCCLYAILPQSYKTVLKSTSEDSNKYSSVVAYRHLNKSLQSTFFFNKKLCLLYIADVNKCIRTVRAKIEEDINMIERL